MSYGDKELKEAQINFLVKGAKTLEAENAALRERAEKAEADCAGMRATFDLRWKADMRAIKAWQEKTGEELVWPDHADLCVWLLAKLAAADRLIEALDGKAGGLK
jgi:DNA-binding transcriptional regulator YdaS (Cro superfamily)